MTATNPPVQRRRVVLALGSNLGDRLDTLQGAVDALFEAPGMRFVAVSPVYETNPVGGPPQPDYLNAVLIAETVLSPRTVLERAQGAEAAFHRTRDTTWGPRTLDVDIITFGDEIRDEADLVLPHPRAHERAFVLAPWHDIDSGAEIPGRGQVADLLAKAGTDGVRRCDDALQPPA
jgi:2-amino-4-hydroxy-6-hydroxymethyldihydropteridine diphosphokinase